MHDRQGPLIDNERLLAGVGRVDPQVAITTRCVSSKGKIHPHEGRLLSNSCVEKNLKRRENEPKPSENVVRKVDEKVRNAQNHKPQRTVAGLSTTPVTRVQRPEIPQTPFDPRAEVWREAKSYLGRSRAADPRKWIDEFGHEGMNWRRSSRHGQPGPVSRLPTSPACSSGGGSRSRRGEA